VVRALHTVDCASCLASMPFMKRLRFQSKPLIIRLLLWAVIVVAGAAAVFLSISYVAIPLHVALSPSLHPTLYEWGLYGGSPSQTYASNGLSSPRISIRKDNSLCHDGYTFINFNGDSMPKAGPAILDENLELIWKAEDYGTTTNLKVQTYKGKQYLTFWSGSKGGTMGTGVYPMVSSEHRQAEP
jgi:hypothetical protein